MAKKLLCDICGHSVVTKHAGSSAYHIKWCPELHFWPWYSYYKEKADVCAPCMCKFIDWVEERMKG